MSFATEMQELVTELTSITEFGNSATFTDTPPAVPYNPDTGKTTPGTPVPFATTIGGPVGVNPKLVNGSTIQETDQMIIVEASRMPFDIDMDTTTVTIAGRLYAITSIETPVTNDTDIAHKLIIR